MLKGDGRRERRRDKEGVEEDRFSIFVPQSP